MDQAPPTAKDYLDAFRQSRQQAEQQAQQPGQPYATPSAQSYAQAYAQAYGAAASGQPPTDGLAVASMVIGIASLVTFPFVIGALGGPIALIMGRSAMRRIDRSQGRLQGRGMAKAGLVLGIIATVLLVLVLIGIAAIVVLARVSSSGSSTPATTGT